MSIMNSLYSRLAAFSNRKRLDYQLDELKREEQTSIPQLLPQLTTLTAGEIPKLAAEYAQEHAYYVTNVSSPSAAISLEQTGLLVWIMRTLKPAQIMDTGSGFSSYVLRKEQGNNSETHVAMEDHAGWLSKTCDFLKSKHLSDHNVLLWSEMKSNSGYDRKFDFIYHDMGTITTRILSLPTIIRWLAPNGLLILDDMHKPHYSPHALAILQENNLKAVSLASFTYDKLGRYAYAARLKT